MHSVPRRAYHRVMMFSLLTIWAQLCGARETMNLGWLERIRLQPWDIVVKAKLDTGAKTAAIHATDVTRFERAGEKWVRFKLSLDHRDPQSETILVEKPLARDINIKLRGTTKNDSRPTVKLDFCLGGSRFEGLFTLVNRSKFNYPVLLGRRFLADLAVIDPASRYSAEPTCPKTKLH